MSSLYAGTIASQITQVVGELSNCATKIRSLAAGSIGWLHKDHNTAQTNNAARDQSIHQEYFQYLLAQENGQGLPAASDGLTSLMQPRTDPDGVFDTENRNDSTPPPSYQESDVRPPVYRHNTSTPQSSTVQPVTHTELSWGHGRGHNSQYEQLLAAISRNTADGRPMTRDEAQTALVQRLGELLGVRQ